MIVTRKWINDNKTKGGAWTKSQVNALGLPWPPLVGWARRLEGSVITDDKRKIFEAKIPAKRKGKK